MRKLWVNVTLWQITWWGLLFIDDVIGKVYLPYLGDVWENAALAQCLCGSLGTLLLKECGILIINKDVMAAIVVEGLMYCWKVARTCHEHHNLVSVSNSERHKLSLPDLLPFCQKGLLICWFKIEEECDILTHTMKQVLKEPCGVQGAMWCKIESHALHHANGCGHWWSWVLCAMCGEALDIGTRACVSQSWTKIDNIMLSITCMQNTVFSRIHAAASSTSDSRPYCTELHNH